MKKLFKSEEDYLEAIYNLSKTKDHVHSIEIAQYIGVSKPSICRALQNLSQQGLIEKQPYGAVTLTKEGEKFAQTIKEKHNLVKLLLVNILGVSDEVAEIDACKIEHNLSDETSAKLFEYFNKKTEI